MRVPGIPDYAAALLAAEAALRKCHTLIVDKHDYEGAALEAHLAQMACNDLMLDLELRINKIRR